MSTKQRTDGSIDEPWAVVSALAARPSLKESFEQWLRGPQRPWGLHWLAWKPNRLFFTTLVACGLLLTVLAILPVLRDFFVTCTGLTNLADLGPHHDKPFYRTTLFRLGIAWLMFAGGHYVICFSGPRRTQRTLALLGAVLYLGLLVLINKRVVLGQNLIGDVVTRRIYDEQFTNLQKLRIIEFPPVSLNAFDFREKLRGLDVSTFTDFHRRVMEQFVADEPRLKKHWERVADLDAEKLKTLYIMNFVSGLWSYGNRANVDKPGCVFCNEQNRWEPPPQDLHAYLNARIGCCTDFAYLTKSLLDHEGIDNRLTSISGHIFNEAKLGGRWCIVDATVNIFVEMSWDELFDREHGRESIPVLVFQHASLEDERSDRYRALAGHFRLLTLVRIANYPEHLRKTEHPSLPSYFD